MFLQRQDVFLLHKKSLALPGGGKKLATRFSMGDLKKLNGRPKMIGGKKTKFINVRFTDDEYEVVVALEKELGTSKTDLIRMRVLSDAKQAVINSKELIKHLDNIGAEVGRVGNNINQLARHANVLKLQGSLNPIVIDRFNRLFEEYLQIQQALEGALRKILRAMAN
ncbi:plasmid mobilization protein [Mucilaginibacter pankratovii]|nr:plasmid mobilization relaxosome protein MobC [Mucilaginibacter pankratovii]